MKAALINMPFFSALRPSLAVGLLVAEAKEAGFAVDAVSFNVVLARILGPERYERFCEHRGEMTGEWLFARAAFGESAPSGDEYLSSFPGEAAFEASLGKGSGYLKRLREDVFPRFIDDCLTARDWSQYQVVGFSSTFQQTTASLALARRLKHAYPKLITIIGGANMEGEMGKAHFEAFRFLDIVVSGEADIVFPEILRKISMGQSMSGVDGVFVRGQPPPVRLISTPVAELDSLPSPCFDDYFLDVEAQNLLEHPDFVKILPFQSSRGCWWGAKHHCTFCGLNGMTLRYRSKSPDRLTSELDGLAKRYRITAFEAADNIVDMRYIETLFKNLATGQNDYRFFYESKANLSRTQLVTMVRGGLRAIQPGIESLSTSVLRLMRKGSTALQNVAILKWCRWLDVNVAWNLLYGFSGESKENYDQQYNLLRKIIHLPPPSGCFRLWLERFSPQFKDSTTYGIENIRPKASYGHVFPEGTDLNGVAYFFDYQVPGSVDDSVMAETKEHVRDWRHRWETAGKPSLLFRRLSSAILVDDARTEGAGESLIIEDDEARSLFLAVNSEPHTFDGLLRLIEQRRSRRVSNTVELRKWLSEWIERGWVLEDDGKFFGVVIPLNLQIAYEEERTWSCTENSQTGELPR